MQRIDSSSTLDKLVSDLANTQIADAERSARVQTHLDDFITAGAPAAALEESVRLFNRGLALPVGYNAMRIRVGEVLVADARQRLPNMTLAAQVANAMDLHTQLSNALAQRYASERAGLTPHAFAALQQAGADGLAALCVNAMVAYTLARKLVPECLQAYLQAGAAQGNSITQAVTECLPAFMAQARQRAVPPATPEEEAELARAAACQRALWGDTLDLGEDVLPHVRAGADLAALRRIVQVATPELQDRLIAYYNSDAGQQMRQITEALVLALGAMLPAQILAHASA